MVKLDTRAAEVLAHDPAPAAALIHFLRLSNYSTRDFVGALDAESSEDVLAHTALHALVAGEEFAASANSAERLFALLTLSAALGASEYETSMPASVRTALESCGLVVREPDGAARAAVSVVEHDGVFLIADKLFELVGGDMRFDAEAVAMPPHLSTFRTLTAVSRLPQGKSLLDVGTGAGSIALLGGRAYESVTGIDVQPRAIAMSRLNASLNDRRDIDFILGDCLTFPDGRRYDHVVFNSPGEFDLVDRFATRVSTLIAPGGICLVLAWLHLRADETVAACLTECSERWQGVRVAAHFDYDSPFSATRAEIASGRPRVGSYLTPDMLRQFQRQQVWQRIEVVLTLQPSAEPCLVDSQ